MGILIPCMAKHLLRAVLSMTPGNFLALKTWKGSEYVVARIGADCVIRQLGRFGSPTSTKFSFNLAELSDLHLIDQSLRWSGKKIEKLKAVART